MVPAAVMPPEGVLVGPCDEKNDLAGLVGEKHAKPMTAGFGSSRGRELVQKPVQFGFARCETVELGLEKDPWVAHSDLSRRYGVTVL